MAQVKWTPRALQDIRLIHDFIAGDSREAAAQVILGVLATIQRLATFPLSGRVIPEYESRGVREVIRRPYRIAYRVVNDEVRILRVFHGARLLHPGDFE